MAEYKPRVLVLDLSRVFDIEYSALQMMMEGDTKEVIAAYVASVNNPPAQPLAAAA